MGTYYWLANHSERKYLDLLGAKLGEQRNDFNRMLTQAALQQWAVGRTAIIEYVGDDTGGWDRCDGYEETTCDVLISCFEDGYIPSRSEFGWVYDKFKAAHRLEEFADWVRGWDRK